MGGEYIEADGSFPHDVEGVGREGKQKSQKGGTQMSLNAQEVEERLKILRGQFADIKEKYFSRMPSYEIQLAEPGKDSDGKEFWGCCDKIHRIITISPNVPVDEYRWIMIHEMAHHVREGHGKLMQAKLRRAMWKAASNGNYDDADLILGQILRCQEADKKVRRWFSELREQAEADPEVEYYRRYNKHGEETSQ